MRNSVCYLEGLYEALVTVIQLYCIGLMFYYTIYYVILYLYFECAVLVSWLPLLPWSQACSAQQAPLWGGALKACSREEGGGTWELYHSNREALQVDYRVQ